MLVSCDGFPHSLQAKQVIQDHPLKNLKLKGGQGDWSMCLGILQVNPPHLWYEDNSNLSPSARNNTKPQTSHAQFIKIWCQYTPALLQHGWCNAIHTRGPSRSQALDSRVEDCFVKKDSPPHPRTIHQRALISCISAKNRKSR